MFDLYKRLYGVSMLKMPYDKLQVWKEAMDLAAMVYTLTKQFPKQEQYSLTQQLRRAGVSVPSNIAEGSQRKTDADFANFIHIALGSLVEIETQLILSRRFLYISDIELIEAQKRIAKIRNMLRAFVSTLTANR